MTTPNAPSPLFAYYLSSWETYGHAIDATDAHPIGSPEHSAAEATQHAASDLHDAARAGIVARPVKTWSDVVELARVVANELWNLDEDGVPIEAHSENEDLERALLKAVLTMGARHGNN